MREKGKTSTKHQVEATGATLLRWKPVDPKWRRGVSPSPRYRVRKKSVQKERGKGGGGVFFTPKEKYIGRGGTGKYWLEFKRIAVCFILTKERKRQKGGRNWKKKTGKYEDEGKGRRCEKCTSLADRRQWVWRGRANAGSISVVVRSFLHCFLALGKFHDDFGKRKISRL